MKPIVNDKISQLKAGANQSAGDKNSKDSSNVPSNAKDITENTKTGCIKVRKDLFFCENNENKIVNTNNESQRQRPPLNGNDNFSQNNTDHPEIKSKNINQDSSVCSHPDSTDFAHTDHPLNVNLNEDSNDVIFLGYVSKHSEDQIATEEILDDVVFVPNNLDLPQNFNGNEKVSQNYTYHPAIKSMDVHASDSTQTNSDLPLNVNLNEDNNDCLNDHIDHDLEIDEFLNAIDFDALVQYEDDEAIDGQSHTNNTPNGNCDNPTTNCENTNKNCDNVNKNWENANKNCENANENWENANNNFESSNNNNENEHCVIPIVNTKCDCPMLLVRGFPKQWKLRDILRYFNKTLRMNTNCRFWITIIKSLFIEGRLVDGCNCLVEFQSQDNCSLAVRKLERRFVEGVPLQTSFFTGKMNRYWLNGQDIICKKKYLSKPVNNRKTETEVDTDKSNLQVDGSNPKTPVETDKREPLVISNIGEQVTGNKENGNYENTNNNCSNTNESCENTIKSCENTDKSHGNTNKSCENTDKSCENTDESCENTDKSCENANKSCEDSNKYCESSVNNKENENHGNLNDTESNRDVKLTNECHCPMLLIKGYPKIWTSNVIQRYLESKTGLKNCYVTIIKSPVYVKGKIVGGCLLEFLNTTERSAALQCMKRLKVKGVPLEIRYFSERMKRRMLNRTGQGIICMNKVLVTRPVDSVHGNSNNSGLVTNNPLKRTLESDEPAENPSNKKSKTMNITEGATISTKTKNPLAPADPFNVKRVVWKPNDAVNETYGLSKDLLDRLGISLPLSNCILVNNVNPQVTTKHIEKIKAMFSLAGNIVHISIGWFHSKYWTVEYEHPLEAVQAISMFNNQKICDQVVTVTPIRPVHRKNSLEEIYLPEGLQSIGPGLGCNGTPIIPVGLGKSTYEFTKSTVALAESKDSAEDAALVKSTYKNKAYDAVDKKSSDEFGRDTVGLSKSPNDNSEEFIGLAKKPNETYKDNPGLAKSRGEIAKDTVGLAKSSDEVPRNAAGLANSKGEIAKDQSSSEKSTNVSPMAELEEGELPDDNHSKDLKISKTNKYRKEICYHDMTAYMTVLPNLYSHLKQQPALKQETVIILQRYLLRLALIISQKTNLGKVLMGDCVLTTVMGIDVHPQSNSRDPRKAANIMDQNETSDQPNLEVLSDLYTQIKQAPILTNETIFALQKQLLNIALVVSQKTGKNVPQQFKNLLFPPEIKDSNVQNQPSTSKRKKIRKKKNSPFNPKNQVDPLLFRTSQSTSTENLSDNYSDAFRIAKEQQESKLKEIQMNAIQQLKCSASQERQGTVYADPVLPILNFSGLPPSMTGHTLQNKMKQVGELVFCAMLGHGRAMVRFRRQLDVDRCYNLFHLAKLDGHVIVVDIDFSSR